MKQRNPGHFVTLQKSRVNEYPGEQMSVYRNTGKESVSSI